MRTRLSAIIVPLLAGAALAQPTAFTYQGRLSNGAQVATGVYDFQFRLFDAASAGSQLGPTLCVDNVNVTGGLFSVMLDFGPQYGSAASRFLEIQVRADTGLSCTNGAGFSALGPRAPINAVPLAAHASAAFTLDSPDGSHMSSVFVDNSGNVGVGTTTPQARLHVVTPGAGVRIQGDINGTASQTWMSFLDAAGTEMGRVGDVSPQNTAMYLISYPGDIHLSTAGLQRLTVAANGNVGVGIGATAPVAKLDVHGDIGLGPLGQFRAAAGEESLRIVRGVINSDGTIGGGTGFAVSHPATGQYNVTFPTTFGEAPTVTATVMESVGPNTSFAMAANDAPSGANLFVFQRSDGASVDRVVQFIAVGPR